ncbi:unnamed protein product [Periconia digitata]|uniref:Uncharacterized protein n=1 Tax=Periconia digitata TaxID=1303443 RepID=A0A9W4UMV8_9PLEO|nr:unnamed protein product [Periconia digitata]
MRILIPLCSSTGTCTTLPNKHLIILLQYSRYHFYSVITILSPTKTKFLQIIHDPGRPNSPIQLDQNSYTYIFQVPYVSISLTQKPPPYSPKPIHPSIHPYFPASLTDLYTISLAPLPSQKKPPTGL